MEYQSLFSYFWFGTCLRYLLDVMEGTRIKGEAAVLFNLERLFENFDSVGLPVSRRVASSELHDLLEEFRAADESSTVTADQAETLHEAMKTVRTTVGAEIQGVGAYVVTPKRLDVKKLTDSVEELFVPGVYDRLPEVARYDFSEAGKCIAFERATAAAFHCLLRTARRMGRFRFVV